MDITKKINDSLNFINKKYPHINYGGCGLFAYYLSETLEHKYDFETEIFYIPYKSPPALKKNYDIWFKHIFIRIDNYLIDNNGFRHISKFDKLKPLSREKLFEMINIRELWNDRFDHTKSEEMVMDIKSIF